MATYDRREIVTTRVEYVLPSPTDIGEFSKAYNAARRDLGIDELAALPSDDVIQIYGRDGEIVLAITKDVTR